jgi:hypothetical protein
MLPEPGERGVSLVWLGNQQAIEERHLVWREERLQAVQRLMIRLGASGNHPALTWGDRRLEHVLLLE